VVCIGWNVAVGGILFKIIGMLVGNRVPAAVEIAGLDIPEMGAEGYPEYIKPVLPEEVAAPAIAAKAV
jgi:ammonia channel protein AmtB